MTNNFKENEVTELKKSTSELKSGIVSIVSILNKHQGGKLYFGIKDDGIVVGQNVSSKTLREVSEAIASQIEPKIYPKINNVKIEFKKEKYGFTVVFYRKKIGKDLDIEKENVGINVGINSMQMKILSLIAENQSITQEEISKKLKITLRTVERNVNILKEKEIIRRKGSNKTGYWEIIK